MFKHFESQFKDDEINTFNTIKVILIEINHADAILENISSVCTIMDILNSAYQLREWMFAHLSLAHISSS